MTATQSQSQSLPVTRASSPIPPSLPVPTDIRSSLSAWWSNSSYKDARIAESRLLLRIPTFSPTPPAPPNKSWFSWSATTTDHRIGEEVVPPVQVGETGLIATLKNVFIPTPNPDDAPKHPADPRGGDVVPNAAGGSPSSSSSSLARKGSLKAGFEARAKGKGEYKDYINTLEISSEENKDCKEAVVVLHGYAAALGFFFRNWEPIATSSASTGRRTFFLDWLGMGLSSRPSPSLLSSPSTSPIPTRVSRAEHFFLASLESWRIASGLDKMVLVGHSLGGYLASAYAVRYPERVSGLILVSPAGIPRGPEYRKYKTSGEAESAEREDAVDAVEMEMDAAVPGAEEPKGEAKQWKENRQNSVLRRGATKFFVWGWEKGLSPFSILRGIGPLGPLMAGRYSLRRFAAQSEEDVRDLHAYIYNTSIMKGSGEFCISHILSPGAHARIPILDRISQVKVPVTFLYGENDWMDVEGGRASVVELNKAGNMDAKVHVVPKAGHHVYLDNADRTNQIIEEAFKALPKPAKE